MPLLPGEERVLTVFADLHYYFTAPTLKPLHHRFDKGSYLYLYYNATQYKTRIEVANNPGTSDQDAFNGALDNIYLQHSTTFPTRCTITVDGHPQSQNQSQPAFPPPPGAGANAYEWQLPSGDPRDEAQTPLRLHTIDVYFWTQDDASQFLDTAERYLAPSQIDTDRHPYPPPSQSTVNPVVQQLESIAISDPAYQSAKAQYSPIQPGSASPSTTHSQTITTPSALPPPPPLNHPSPSSTAHHQAQATPPAEEQNPPQCAPLPYNPAAPAAPEPIQHREKTPPPADGADGTGLAAAVAADNGMHYDPRIQSLNYAPPPSAGLPPPSAGLPPPSAGLPFNMPGSYASPPPSAGLPPSTNGLSHSASVSRAPVQTPHNAGIGAPVPSYTPSFLSSGQPQHQHQQQPQIPQQAQPQPPPQPQIQQQQITPAQQPQMTPMTFAPPPKDPNHNTNPTPPAPNPTHTPSNSYPYAQQQSQPQPSPALYSPPIYSPPPSAISGGPISPAPSYTTFAGYDTPSTQQPQHNTVPTPAPAPAATGPTRTASVNGGIGDYSMHSQLYRPTEAEALSKHQKYAQHAVQQPGQAPQRPRKFEDGAHRIESGVNRFLKKLEKRL